MSLHLIKLSVGSESLEQLAAWQQRRLRLTGRLCHQTRMYPRRAAELLAGGSIYWVVRGQILARQALLAIERLSDEEGRSWTLLQLAPALIRVVPRRQRAFQGWRYLAGEAAPPDLVAARGAGKALPPALAEELRELGLL